MTQGNLSRRGFLDRSTAAMVAAGIPLPGSPARSIADDEEKKAAESRKKVGPNDEIVIGLIGCGGQGTYDHPGRLEAEGRPDRRRLRCRRRPDATRRSATSVKEVAKNGGKLKPEDVAKYHDFRELVARDDLNAVIVGTVDHWHALTSIAAMKPASTSIARSPWP